MARYFFHYQYADEKLLEDRVGIELPDLEAVEEEARSVAIEILSEELLEEGASLTEPRCLEIEDEDGAVVLYVPFWLAPGRAVGAAFC